MGFFLLLLFLTLSYLRPGELFLSLAPYRIMLWLGGVSLIAAVVGLLLGRRTIFRALQIHLMAAFVTAVVLSRVAQGWLGGGLLALEEFGITAMVFFLVILTVNTLSRLRVLVTLLVLLSLMLVVQGALAYHFGYLESLFIWQRNVALDNPNGMPTGETDEGSADGAGPDVLKRIRSVGFLHDPNDLAQALVVVLPFLALAWRPGHWFRNFALVIIPGLLLLYGIYLTHSRGGMLSLLILILLALWGRMGRTRAMVLTAVLAVLLLALDFSAGRTFSFREPSSRGRLEAWSAGLGMLKSHPIWGVGYGSFNDFYELTAHNSFVLCFAELGLIGYFFWMALLVVTTLEISSLGKLSGEEPLDHDLRRWAGAIRLALYSFLVAALFLSRTYILTLYLLLAMAVAVVDMARRAGKPVAAVPLIRWTTRTGVLELASIVLIYMIVNVRFL